MCVLSGEIKKINEALNKVHIDAEFGQQYVNTIQLCAMLKTKAKSGYYQVEHSVRFGTFVFSILSPITMLFCLGKT